MVNACVLPILTYGLPIWHPSPSRIASINSILVRPLLRVLALPRNTEHIAALVYSATPGMHALLQQSTIRVCRLFALRPAGHPTADLWSREKDNDFTAALAVHPNLFLKSLSAQSSISKHLRNAWVFVHNNDDIPPALYACSNVLHSYLSAFTEFDTPPLPQRILIAQWKQWRASNRSSHLQGLIDSIKRPFQPSPSVHVDSITVSRIRSRLRFDRSSLNASRIKHSKGTLIHPCPLCGHTSDDIDHYLLRCTHHSMVEARRMALTELFFPPYPRLPDDMYNIGGLRYATFVVTSGHNSVNGSGISASIQQSAGTSPKPYSLCGLSPSWPHNDTLPLATDVPPSLWESSDWVNNKWRIRCASYAPSTALITNLHALRVGLDLVCDNTIVALRDNDQQQLQSPIVIGITHSFTHRVITEKSAPPTLAAPLVDLLLRTIAALSLWGRRPIYIAHVPIDADPIHPPPGIHWPHYMHLLAQSATLTSRQRNPYDFSSARALLSHARFRVSRSDVLLAMQSYLTPRHILSPTTLPNYNHVTPRATTRMIESTTHLLLALNNIRSV